MKPFYAMWIASMFVLAACAPREEVIDSGVAGTLTALAPTSVLPEGRPTSTPVPIVLPATPSAARAPTDTPEPTATEGPTPTNTAIVSTADRLILADTFDSAGPWAVGDTTDSTVTVSGGVLTYTQKNPGSFSYRVIGRQGGDFTAEVTTTLADSCGSGDKFGLLFRLQDVNNYYAYQIDCDGRYRLLRFAGGATTPVVDWTPSPAIERGAKSSNHLVVNAQGGSMALFVNGVKLTTAADLLFSSGRFGLIVGSNVTKNFTVIFDDLKVYELR